MSSGSSLRVFVIDDDPLVLAVTRRVLVRAGYAVEIFDEPRRALGELARLAPFAVVADLNMPDLDGRALLAEVQTLAPEALRILYTGESNLEGLDAGVAHATLTKTGGMQTLPDTLARLQKQK